jgi:AraC-like DNA-binding protein
MNVRQVMDSNQASGGIREGFPGQRMVVLPRPVVLRAINGCLPLKLVPSDVGYFPDAADHYVNRPGGAGQCIIILCVRGMGWVRIGKLEHDIQPGDLAVILPHQAHSYGCGAQHPWTIHWCHAAGPAVNYFTDMLIRRDVLPILHIGNYLRLIPFYETMTEELTSGYSLTHLTVAAMALGHLLALIAAGGQSAQINQSHHHRIPLAIEYMKSRWQRSVTVPEIARACNLSTSHFTVLFKKFTGYPPLDYFLRLKMQRAAEMLDTTNRPLKEIAADIGLSDPLYFSRVFHRIYGLSPSAYRHTTKG